MASGKTIRFTKRAVEAVQPTDRTRYVYDARTPGLALRISPNATKTFVLYRKINGRPERITLGRFPAVTVDIARLKATEPNGEIARGKNPAETIRAIKAEMTLGKLFERYLAEHAKVHKKSWREDERIFQRYLSRWRERQLSQILRDDVLRLHTRIGRENGMYAANRLLSLVSTVFNKAADWGYRGENPTKRVKKFRENSRDRFLQPTEMASFFEALSKEPNTTARDYFLLLLMTGARRSNALAMRWDQVDLESKIWRIPDTKNNAPQSIPLVTEAIAILRQRQAFAAGDWVFPGVGRTGHLVEPKKAWERILTHARIRDLRIHDLRRSLGSWQAATGANLSIIGKTLNHKSINTTAIYARLNLDPVRAAMETATRAMMAAGNVGEPTDVLLLRRKK